MRDFETNDLISKIEEIFEQLDDAVYEAVMSDQYQD